MPPEVYALKINNPYLIPCSFCEKVAEYSFWDILKDHTDHLCEDHLKKKYPTVICP